MVDQPHRRYHKASVQLPVTKGRRFRGVITGPIIRRGDAAISNATINARIQYGNSAHMGDWLQAKTFHLKLRPNGCR